MLRLLLNSPWRHVASYRVSIGLPFCVEGFVVLAMSRFQGVSSGPFAPKKDPGTHMSCTGSLTHTCMGCLPIGRSMLPMDFGDVTWLASDHMFKGAAVGQIYLLMLTCEKMTEGCWKAILASMVPVEHGKKWLR